MDIVLYILGAASCLMGGFILFDFFTSHNDVHNGQFAGGILYILGGLLTFNTLSWYPLIVVWILNILINKLFGILKKGDTSGYINESEKVNMDTLIDSVVNKKEDKKVQSLIEFAKLDKNILNLFLQTNTNDGTLEKIYSKLTSLGTGQIVKGHHVTSSSFSNFHTLKYLIEHFDGEKFSIDGLDSYNSGLQIANRLIVYFENEEKTEII